MSRVWVGGATGFAGAELVRQLRSLGHEVVAVSRSGGRVGDVTVQAVDGADPEEVRRSAEGCERAFFALGLVSRDPADASRLHQANVVATERGLLGLREAGVRRVVYLSTSGTVACGRDPARAYTEDDATPHELISRWPYYRSKLFGERVALGMNRAREFEVVVAMPSLLLGPGDRRASSTLDVRRFLAGSIPAIPAGGVAFVDVRDAAAAMLVAMERGRAGERYLLSAANMPLTVFFGRLARLSGKALPSMRLPRRPELAVLGHWAFDKALSWLGTRAPVDRQSVELGSYYWYCDCTKAARQLGFTPRDAGSTLRDTIADIEAERQAP